MQSDMLRLPYIRIISALVQLKSRNRIKVQGVDTAHHVVELRVLHGTLCIARLDYVDIFSYVVLQGAERFMTSWHKSEKEASLQRAIKRADSGPKNSPTGWEGGGRKQRGKKASVTRPTAWRDMWRIELQRLVVLILFPSPPFAVALGLLSLRISLSLCELVFSPLFYFILFCFTGTYPRPSLWPSACCTPGSWWCAVPIFIFYIIFSSSFFFTSHSVWRGAGGSTICSDSFASCILSPC